MNPIIEGYPDYVLDNGYPRKIRTGFRYWLQLSNAIDDYELSDMEKTIALYDLSGLEPSGDIERDIKVMCDFISPNKSRSRKSERVFDWDEDADRIIASFQMQYGIDLTSPDTQMHWWRFLALFSGLGDDTPIMQAIRIRKEELPTGNDSQTRERRKKLMDAKNSLRLKPKNPAELMKRDAEIWE